MNSNINPNDHMPLKDKLFLSPMQKYKIYGEFPWKLIIHIFLILSTTCQILIIISKTSYYSRAQERFFHEQFVNEPDQTDNDFPKKFYLYSMNDLISHIQRSIDNYYLLKDISLERIKYPTPLNETMIHLEMFYMKNYYHRKEKKNFPKLFKINKDNLGPFDPLERNKLKEMLRITNFFQLNYTLYTFVPFTSEDVFKCFIWEIKQKYSYEQRGHFIVTLNIERLLCQEQFNYLENNDYPLGNIDTKSILYNYYWIHMIVIILSITKIIITVKYLHTRAKIYWHLKSKYRKTYAEVKRIGHPDETKVATQWSLLSSKDKNQFFNMWNIIDLIGNIVQLFGSAIMLYEEEEIMPISEYMIGVGCFIAYLTTGKYLQNMKHYFTVIATIMKAVPHALQYFFGVLPILLGFILFGVAIFWRSERFSSIPMAFISLFAMMNGDSVLDIVKDLKEANFFIGQVYGYLFGIIFIAVVMNVFVSIIEEAYVASKMKNQNHWIYSFLKKKKAKKKTMGKITQNDEEEEDKDKLIKGERKLYEKVRSKTILREAINIEMTEDEQLVKKDKKKNKVKKSKSFHIDNDISVYTNKIDNAMTELENLTKKVLKTHESKMKKELKLFIKENIAILMQDKIKIIEESLNTI